MKQLGLNGSATLVAGAFLVVTLAGPAAAMESAGETERAGTPHETEQRLDEHEERVAGIRERIEGAAIARANGPETRPFVETYFEELDRYGD